MVNDLIASYRRAIIAWRDADGVREACHTLGMSLREYADRYVDREMTAAVETTNTTKPRRPLDREAAFEAALVELLS